MRSTDGAHHAAPNRPAAPPADEHAPDAPLRPLRDRAGVWIGAALVVLFCGLPLFEGLGNTDLKGDEPIYAFAVDRMLENGDWLTPRAIPSADAAFLEKPPLKFWIVAAGIRSGLLRNDEFGHRFWDAAFGLAAFLYVFAIGRIAAGPVCGVIATLVLFSHLPLILDHGVRSSNMEAALLLSYAAGIYHTIAWSRAATPAQRWGHPLAVAVWFVLGFMTKFVAAVFLPAILVVNAALFAEWRRRALADWRQWTVAALAVVALVAPWFIYQHRLHGAVFWQIILGEHVYVRFTGHLDPTHLRPWHFYFSQLYRELSRSNFVWGGSAILVVAGLSALTVKSVRQRWDVGTLLLLWFALPFTAISLGTSKLYHYTYPFLPPVAIAAGLLPAAILDAGSPARRGLQRLLDRIAGSRTGHRIRSGAAARQAVFWLGVAALVLSAATVIFGPVRLSVGGVMLLRNSSTLRPMLLGVLLLTLAGHGRLFTGALLLPLIVLAMPWTSYWDARRELPRERTELRRLRDCLRERQSQGAPSALESHTRHVLGWDYWYYFRDTGWSDSQAPGDQAALAARLFDEREPRGVLLHNDEHSAFLANLAAALPAQHAEAMRLKAYRLDERFTVVLPGPYAPCAVPMQNVTSR